MTLEHHPYSISHFTFRIRQSNASNTKLYCLVQAVHSPSWQRKQYLMKSQEALNNTVHLGQQQDEIAMFLTQGSCQTKLGGSRVSHFSSSGQSICILLWKSTAYGTYAIGVVQLSILDIESKPYVCPSVMVKIPLRTRLRLRQMVVSNVLLNLNEVHEPRLYHQPYSYQVVNFEFYPCLSQFCIT